MGKKCRRNIA